MTFAPGARPRPYEVLGPLEASCLVQPRQPRGTQLAVKPLGE